ncbi:MAG TPA: hypothetical protein VJ981_05495 [Gammaproteobacteria bacterium]|nr:hypothetical protein [Gammaproteobacteria bacterium]
MRILYGLFLILLLATGGCNNINVKNQVSKLDTSLRHYGADLRWGRFNQAYQYHVSREGTRPAIDLANLENFSVTNFKPIDPVVNEIGTEAEIPVEIDYYDEQYGTLKKIRYTQHWWYDTESKHWFTESDYPHFK